MPGILVLAIPGIKGAEAERMIPPRNGQIVRRRNVHRRREQIVIRSIDFRRAIVTAAGSAIRYGRYAGRVRPDVAERFDVVSAGAGVGEAVRGFLPQIAGHRNALFIPNHVQLRLVNHVTVRRPHVGKLKAVSWAVAFRRRCRQCRSVARSENAKRIQQQQVIVDRAEVHAVVLCRVVIRANHVLFPVLRG